MKKGALPTSEKLRVLYNVSIGVKKNNKVETGGFSQHSSLCWMKDGIEYYPSTFLLLLTLQGFFR